jgi:hypothetical protein
MSFPGWLLRCLKPVLYVYLRKSIGIGIEIMGLFARILNLIAIKLWSINSNKTTSLQHETSGACEHGINKLYLMVYHSNTH